MRIFYSADGSDPMLLDTKAGLHALYDKLKAFVASSEATAEFVAATDRSPQPYEEFLRGLRLSKTAGATRLTLGADRWLALEGSPSALEDCIRRFLVKEENGHQHLYTVPISLIIESDSAWEDEIAS
jgi:hypothetical protein